MSSSLRSGKLPPVPVEEPADDLSAGVMRGAGAGAWFLIGAAVVGLGIATYLTTLHYAGVAPICTTNGFVNCGSVLKSSYSVVPGTSIPVTVPGMLWFIVSGWLAVVSILAARRGSRSRTWLRPAHLTWCRVGPGGRSLLRLRRAGQAPRALRAGAPPSTSWSSSACWSRSRGVQPARA